MRDSKRLVLLSQAQADAFHIYEYYNSVGGRQTVDRVLGDIVATLERVSDFPNSGTNVSGDRQMTVTGRYRFVIVFRNLPQRIEVLSIFRHQDRLPSS